MQIVFTDPPPPSRRHGRSQHPWEDIARQLKSRPGEWALCLRDMHDSAASAIRLGKLTAFPKGEFDARGVIPEEKRDTSLSSAAQRKKPVFDLYVRYIPESERTTED